MAKVIVAPTAAEDLRLLSERLHLPSDTRSRVRERLSQLARFPGSGEELAGRWQGFRSILGPWRWMLIVFAWDQGADQVNVVTIQDSRSADSVKSK